MRPAAPHSERVDEVGGSLRGCQTRGVCDRAPMAQRLDHPELGAPSAGVRDGDSREPVDDVVTPPAARGGGRRHRYDDNGTVRFHNCPFHPLTEKNKRAVCGVNLALVEGILAGLGDRTHKASLEPQPGGCCVALR